MSQDNVEVVRRIWDLVMESIDHGDPVAAFDAAFDQGLVAPTSTFTPAAQVLGSETFVGREGFAGFLRAWTEDFVDLRFRLEALVDAGDDRVVALMHQSARGKRSGAPVELRLGAVYTVRGGQLIEVRHYLDPAEALEAAGLPEQDAHTGS